MASNQPVKPQTIKKHPDEWERDLNPTHMQGQNIGPHNLEDSNPPTAADDKELTRSLQGFRQDELKEIPLVPSGSRLEQGAVYLDLRNPSTGPLVATGDMIAGPAHLYTPKSEVPYEYWNRLLTMASSAPEAHTDTDMSEEAIDSTLADSFPASDPPSWTTGRDHSRAHQQTPAQTPRKKR